MSRMTSKLTASAIIAAVFFVGASFVAASPAAAVVCAKGVYRAGCAGPNGVVTTTRVAPHRHGAVCRRYGIVGGVRRCVVW